MKILKSIAAATAVAMLAAQPIAAANPAQKLSLKGAVQSDVRASGKAGNSRFVEGVPTLAVILGLAAIITLVVVLSDGSDSDSN